MSDLRLPRRLPLLLFGAWLLAPLMPGVPPFWLTLANYAGIAAIIALGLVVAAPLGGILFAWAVIRSGAARMPEGLDWASIAAVAPLKGIGFTVAFFISTLAFDEVALQNEAKLAILFASVVAGLIGVGALVARHAATRRHPRA